MTELYNKSLKRSSEYDTQICAGLKKTSTLRCSEHYSEATQSRKPYSITLKSRQDRPIYYQMYDEKPILIKITVGEAMKLQKKIQNYYPALRKMVISEYMGWTCRDYRCDKKCEAVSNFNCEQYINLSDKQ